MLQRHIGATRLTIIFLTLLPLIFFWRETLGWLTLGAADIVAWFFPMQTLAVQQIKSGSLPFWNPNHYSGTPLYAQGLIAVFDPLNWIYLLGVTSRTLTTSLEASYIISLIATFGYARSLRLKLPACVLAAVVYSLSGFAVSRSIYLGLPHIYALTPLVLLFIERLYQRMQWRDAIAGSLIVAWQVFAGHLQPFVYASLLAASYALFCALFRRDGSQGLESLPAESSADNKASPRRILTRLRFLAQCGSMYAFGIMLSAVQWLPIWEVADQSVRQERSFEFYTWQSQHPLSLLSTLFPFFHGQGKTIYRLPYWGSYWTHNEGQFYLGVLALSLAAGALWLWREQSRLVRFWSFVGIFALVLSLGKHVEPVARLLYRAPFLSGFRSPNRHWMEVTLAIAMLSAIVLDHLLRHQARIVARITMITAAGLTLISVGVGTLVFFRREQVEDYIRLLPDLYHLQRGFLQQAGPEFYIPVITSLCTLTLLVLFIRAKSRIRWFPAVLALLIIDYNLYAAFAPINSSTRLESLIGQAMPSMMAAKQSESSPIRYHLMIKPGQGEFDPFWFAGHEMATGYDPLLSLRYKTFTGINEAGRSDRLSLLESQDWTLDLLNVRYLLVPPTVHAEQNSLSGRIEHGGIAFTTDQSSRVELRSGQEATFSATEGAADTLAIVSNLANAAEIFEGEVVADLTMSCGSGGKTLISMRAGRDTSEWAYDRADVHPAVQHSRSTIAESWPGDDVNDFQAYSYLARFTLPENISKCASTRFVKVHSRARGNAAVNIQRLALYDSASKQSIPLIRSINNSLLDSTRWREVQIEEQKQPLQNFQIYENLRYLPRAWLVRRVEPRSDKEQLQLIRGEICGRDGETFDPREVALVDPDVVGRLDRMMLQSVEESPVGSEQSPVLKIVKREPHSIIIDTVLSRSSMLVISEIFYPGWRVKVDGREVELWRVNYLLQGVALSAGSHRVEVFYRPRTLAIGAMVSFATIPFLLLIVVMERRKKNGK